jgi:hypothetical protein
MNLIFDRPKMTHLLYNCLPFYPLKHLTYLLDIFFDLKHLLDLKHLNTFERVQREKERVIDLAVEVNFFPRHLCMGECPTDV